jgi:ribonuclease Z
VSWLVQPRLVSDPFSDPGLYLDFRFGRRALLFDLGDLFPLSARELMRVTHVFVSHTHLDHIAGFDRLLRLCLHRPEPLHLFGPPGFIDQVEHRLRSVTWNLLGPDSVDFRVVVSTFEDDRLAHSAEFRAREAFARRELDAPRLGGGCVVQEEAFRVEAVTLDHGIPCLAFALVETLRVNVWRGALDALGLPVGPWLNDAKRAVRLGLPDETLFRPSPDLAVSLGELRRTALRAGPGQKVVYVTDAGPTEENLAAIVRFAGGADQLFIEAPFLDADRDLAASKYHLTAALAGRIGHLARVRHLVPFHFSARYLDRPGALAEEARQASDGNFAFPGT